MAEWLIDQVPTVADPDPTTTLSSGVSATDVAASFTSTTKMPTAGYTARIVVGYGATGEIVNVTGGAGNPYTTSAFVYDHAAGTQVNVVITKTAFENAADDRIAANAGVVHTTGAESKSGLLTLSSGLTVSSGAISVTSNGSVSACAYQVGSGTNTGIYRSGNNMLFAANGTLSLTLTSAIVSPQVRLQTTKGISFGYIRNTGATINLVQATSPFKQVFACASGGQTVNLPLVIGGSDGDYRHLDPDALVGATNTCTWQAQDPGGPGGSITWNALNGVRGGTVIISNPSEVWDFTVVGTVPEDGNFDPLGAAWLGVRLA